MANPSVGAAHGTARRAPAEFTGFAIWFRDALHTFLVRSTKSLLVHAWLGLAGISKKGLRAESLTTGLTGFASLCKILHVFSVHLFG